MSCTKHMTDGACSDCKIEQLEQYLEITSQARTMYRIALENVEAENEKLKQAWEEAATLGTEHEARHRELLASLPKIKADAVLAIKGNVAQTNNGIEGFYSYYDIQKYANKLKAGE